MRMIWIALVNRNGGVVLNRLILHMLRRSGILLALTSATALSLGLAAPANAAVPRDRITTMFDPSKGTPTIRGNQQDLYQ
jgi:hypothetical protein